MSIGIAPSKEHWYCTNQRVLVLPQQCIVEHEPREAIVAQSQRRKFAFGRSHNLSEGFDSENLSCCLTPHTILWIFILNRMNHRNVVYLVCPGNRHNAKFCINLVNAQWSSDLWIIIVIAQSWSSSMYTFNCLCNGYKCISRVCNISFYKRNIWLQIPIFSRLRLHCP